jgi:general secretion pathway protein J
MAYKPGPGAASFSRPRRQRGLTLVEVIIATVILSMIMLATMTALRTFANTYRAISGVSGESGRMREVTRFLRDSVRNAVPLKQGSFIGSSQEMVWLSAMDRAGEAGGVMYFRLRLEGETLMLAFAPFDPEAPGAETAAWGQVIDDYALLTGVTDWRLAYQVAPNQPWIDRFEPKEGGLPGAVSVQLKRADDAWPPMVMALNEGGVAADG